MKVPADTRRTRRGLGIETEVLGVTLPTDLIKRIKVEAAERGTWPSQVVEDRLRSSYQREPTR